MRSFQALAWALVLLFVSATGASSAKPYTWDITGPEAKGGNTYFFLDQVKLAKNNRIRVVLDKECWSSCTLYTSLLRQGLLCAKPGTRLFFHQYVVATDIKGKGGVLMSFKNKGPVTGPAFARIWNTYPLHVRQILNDRGGLPPHGQELVISARELGIPTC